MSPWMTIAEAADYSRLSQTVIRRMIVAGRLLAGGSDRHYVIHREHLDRQIIARFPAVDPKRAALFDCGPRAQATAPSRKTITRVK